MIVFTPYVGNKNIQFDQPHVFLKRILLVTVAIFFGKQKCLLEDHVKEIKQELSQRRWWALKGYLPAPEVDLFDQGEKL